MAGSAFIGTLSAHVFSPIGLVLFTAGLTYFMLVFAKMLPKIMAVQLAEQVVVRRAPLIRFLRETVKPVLWLALIWVRVLPLKKGHTVSRDDLHSIIRHYNKRGVIGRSERKLAERVLATEQQTLAKLFSEQSSQLSLTSDTRIGTISETLRNNPQKRYVVMEDNRAIGVVLYRHLALSLVKDQTERTVGELIRQAIHLPPETTLFEAVNQFKTSGVSVAISTPEQSSEKPNEVRLVTAKQVYQALLRAS